MAETLKSTAPDLVDDFDPNKIEDVAAKHADMRERCPVAHVRTGKQDFWSLTRYEDITAAARNPAVFANGKRQRFATRRPPLESDPPEHTIWRRILAPFFTPKAVEAFEPVARGLARDLVAPLLAAGGGDVAHGLARPLPTQVLLSYIGQPAADWLRIKECCEDAYLDRSEDPADRAQFAVSNEVLWDYSRKLVEARIASSADPAKDMTAAMLAGTKDIEGSHDLVVGVIRLLLAAGHDSTTSALGICLHYLARSPDDQATLRANPSKLRVAIEEMLRYETPVLSMPRMAAQDAELRGKSIQTGDRVMLNFAAANRDPDAFADADRCLIDRSPNAHLAFGIGIHACVGVQLARQEIRVALEELLASTKSFTLAGEVQREFWHPFGARNLPIRIEV